MIPYVSPCEASRFIEKILMSSDPERIAWEKLITSDREAVLGKAMIAIEAANPRYAEKDIPEAFKVALSLEAAATACRLGDPEAVQRADLQKQGVTAFSIGKLSESYGKGRKSHTAGLLSEDAYRLLRPYLGGGAPIG